MMVTLEDLQQDLKKIELAKEGYIELADAGMDYETARVVLVNRSRITMGAASDLIDALAKATGRKLEGAPA